MPCCRQQPQQREASIVNPYTGTVVSLGMPYIFESRAYFSMNRVSMALSTSDLGVSPSINNTGGSFFACNRGMGGGIGYSFGFSYPTNLLGRPQNNTHFLTNCGRIELLCHTSQAGIDPFQIFAYISLETVSDFMLSGGFFTSFEPDSEHSPSIWHFAYPGIIRGIASPPEGTRFRVGDMLSVRLIAQDTNTASLLINGRMVELKSDLGGQNDITFSDYPITANDIGNIVINAEVRNRGGTFVEIQSVTVPVSETETSEPDVIITYPRYSDVFAVGDTVTVEASVVNATRSELAIGNHSQELTHPCNRQSLRFDLYTFTSNDAGNTNVTVTAHNSQGNSVSYNINLLITPSPVHGRVIEIPTIMSGVINDTPWSRNIQEHWFSYYRMTGASPIDSNGFYQIAIGPRVLNPDYPDTGRIWADDFSFPYRIDAVLEHRTTKVQKILECITNSSGKAHTFNRYPHELHPRNHLFLPGTTVSFNVESGIHQTGIAYPLSWNASNESQWAIEHLDGSTIEFMNNGIDFNPNHYRLLRIVVHD